MPARYLPISFTLLALAAMAAPAPAASFVIGAQTDLIVPSTRGEANTTWYGWDTFSGNPPDLSTSAPIDDSTPDLGTNPGAARIRTTNGETHLSSSGNFYSSMGTVAEEITFDTTGTLGSGFTTLILQGKTAFGEFGSSLLFGEIGGVSPVVIDSVNAAGQGQFWAQWDIPGNLDTYLGEISTAGPASFVSLDQLTVDTFWNADGYQPDVVTAVPEPAGFALAGIAGCAALLRRRRPVTSDPMAS